MNEVTAIKVLDLWTEICIGSWEQNGTSVTLHTLEDDYEHETIEEAAIDCLPTIEEWIKNIDK